MTTYSVADWIAKATNNASMRAMAREVGLDQGKLRRMIRVGDIAAVFLIARAYDRSPIDGLLEIGAITDSDLRAWLRGAA